MMLVKYNQIGFHDVIDVRGDGFGGLVKIFMLKPVISC